MSPAKTLTDEIADRVGGAVQEALNGPSDRSAGVVFGESHSNNEFHRMLASHILPQASERAGDRPKALFLEWDRTEENLALVKEYNETGSPEIRDRLVEGNIDFQDNGKEQITEQDFKAVLDAARANGFTLMIFDDESVSADAFYNQVAGELGKEVIELTREEIDEAESRRVAQSNPVMVGNIQSQAPEGSFSLVLVGDAHAREKGDIPESLGFSYVRFVEQGETPGIRENHDGARLDVTLRDYELSRDFLANEMKRIGIDFVPVLLSEEARPGSWASEENRVFVDGMMDGLSRAGNLVAAGKYGEAQQALSEVRTTLHERYTPEQIEQDSYFHSVDTLIGSAQDVIAAEIPEPEPAPKPPENIETVPPGPGQR